MSETKTRLWIALFVALVFVCGLSIGLAVSAWFGPRMNTVGFGGQFPPPDRGPGPAAGPGVFVTQRILDRLERETDLTDDQRARLESLFEKREARFREFNREMRSRFESEQASLREEIAAILTPAQMKVFDAARRPGRGRPGPRGLPDRRPTRNP